MSFTHRFAPSGLREDLCFRTRLASAHELKHAWAFVWDAALRSNIAYTLQDVHFDVLLVNNYNVFWTPLAMKYKHALVQIASVIEAALQYMLQMVEDDPRVQEILGQKWSWVDFNDVPLGGRVQLADDQRVVSGIQQKVQAVFDRNTKMKVLIQAAHKVGIVDEALASEIDGLRDIRNRIHIKALSEPEYDRYTARAANDALDTLERFRQVALSWTVDLRRGSLETTLTSRLPTTTAGAEIDLNVNDLVEHVTLGQGVVTAVGEGGIVTIRFFRDSSERRLMVEYAALQKTGAWQADDDIPF